MSSAPDPDGSAIPAPWNLTDRYEREAALAAAPWDAAARETAVAAVERLSERLAALPATDDRDVPDDLLEYWSMFSNQVAREFPRLEDVPLPAVERWLREQGHGDASPAIAARLRSSAIARAVYDAGQQLRRPAEGAAPADDEVPDADARLVEAARRAWQRLEPWVSEPLLAAAAATGRPDAAALLEEVAAAPGTPPRMRQLAARPAERERSTRLLVVRSGPLRADPLRAWLERTTPVLGLAWGGRSLYDEADALTGGKPVVVAARVGGEDDEPAVATFATRKNVLELDIGAHVPDDAALASVATDAGRMLHGDAVIVVDDDDRDAREILVAAREGRDLPRVLWTATGAGFDDASRRARRAERQWDGALLLVADA